jgi:hypothetical protein
MIILGVVSSLLYAVLAFIAYHYQTSATTPWGGSFKAILLVINMLLVVVYWFAFISVKSVNGKSIIKIIFLFSAVFSVIMIFTPPIGSADVYNYAYRARINTVYDENPYIVATGEHSGDMFYDFSPKEWNYLTMQYGPFWTSVSILFSNITKNSFFWNVFIYKLLALVSFFGVAFLLRKILQKFNPGMEMKGLFLYLWSPIIIFEAINNAHNDMFMMFVVVFAIYLLMKKWYILAAIMLLLSILTKYIPLLILPVFVFYIFRDIQETRKKVNFVWVSGILAIIISVIFYLPFWEGIKTFNGLFEQSKIFTYANFSLFPGIIYWVSYVIGSSLSWSRESLSEVARISGLIAFVVLYVWLINNYFRGKFTYYIYYSFMILFVYIFFYLTYLQPWYFIWLIPLATLIDKKYFPQFILICTLAGLLSYTIVMNSLIYVFIFMLIILMSLVTNKNYLLKFLK